MKKPESISKVLVNYGPREEHIINEIKKLKENPLPDNKNEILRRGLHDVRYLADVDEGFYLALLSQLLHLGSTHYDIKILKLSKELAYVIHAIRVSKYGVLQSEIFESIPRELQSIEELIKEQKPNPEDIEEDFKITMKKLADSVDTVFRKSKKEDEIVSGILFPIVFLSDLKMNVGKPRIMKPPITYDKIASDSKRDFLKSCVIVANSLDDNKIKKLGKQLLTVTE